MSISPPAASSTLDSTPPAPSCLERISGERGFGCLAKKVSGFGFRVREVSGFGFGEVSVSRSFKFQVREVSGIWFRVERGVRLRVSGLAPRPSILVRRDWR